MINASFVCLKCKALVVAPSHMVLTEDQRAAMRAQHCRDCLGVTKVKSL